MPATQDQRFLLLPLLQPRPTPAATLPLHKLLLWPVLATTGISRSRHCPWRARSARAQIRAWQANQLANHFGIRTPSMQSPDPQVLGAHGRYSQSSALPSAWGGSSSAIMGGMVCARPRPRAADPGMSMLDRFRRKPFPGVKGSAAPGRCC